MCGSHLAVLAHPDEPRFLVYAPIGRAVDVDATALPESALGDWTARWWDPRTGTWLPGTETIEAARVEAARANGRGFVVENPCKGQDALLFLAEG